MPITPCKPDKPVVKAYGGFVPPVTVLTEPEPVAVDVPPTAEAVAPPAPAPVVEPVVESEPEPVEPSVDAAVAKNTTKGKK